MDELGILRARVAILERRLEQANVETQKLIEAFDWDFGYASGPAEEEEDEEVEESTPMAE